MPRAQEATQLPAVLDLTPLPSEFVQKLLAIKSSPATQLQCQHVVDNLLNVTQQVLVAAKASKQYTDPNIIIDQTGSDAWMATPAKTDVRYIEEFLASKVAEIIRVDKDIADVVWVFNTATGDAKNNRTSISTYYHTGMNFEETWHPLSGELIGLRVFPGDPDDKNTAVTFSRAFLAETKYLPYQAEGGYWIENTRSKFGVSLEIIFPTSNLPAPLALGTTGLAETLWQLFRSFQHWIDGKPVMISDEARVKAHIVEFYEGPNDPHFRREWNFVLPKTISLYLQPNWSNAVFTFLSSQERMDNYDRLNLVPLPSGELYNDWSKQVQIAFHTPNAPPANELAWGYNLGTISTISLLHWLVNENVLLQ